MEGPQAKVPAEVNARAPSANFSRPTEVSKPDAAGGSCPELPCKQPNHYYKLRTLYSKQYYKQTACPSQVPATQQPLTRSASTDLAAADSQPPVEGRPAVLETPEHLPSTFVAPPVRNSGNDSEADPLSEPPAKQMRLKKAMHLKKLNFLKSQQSAECTSHPEPDNGLARREESAAKEDAVERAGSQTAEEKGRGELGPESSREEELPGAPASWEDPSQALQPQKQYACELCGKPFKHPSNLELHKRSHTGTLPGARRHRGGSRGAGPPAGLVWKTLDSCAVFPGASCPLLHLLVMYAYVLCREHHQAAVMSSICLCTVSC